MICGSICSGVSADSVAWHPLGWRHAFYAEIDKFCCAVLKHHYPDVPNYGDFTKRTEFDAIDVLMVSTPCQDFSVAGRREGMGGARGSLTLAALGVVEKTRPRWLVFENVPGLLQADCAIGFREFLSRLAKLGYGFAYRVLDAQFAGLAQRRERVFLVAHLGDWRPAAAVFLDSFSVQGHPAPRRETGEGFTLGVEVGPSGGRFTEVAPTMDARAKDGFIRNQLGVGAIQAIPDPAYCLNAGGCGRIDGESETFIAHSLRADAVAFSCKDHGADAGEIAPTLRAMGHEGSHANAGGQVAVTYPILEAGARTGKSTDDPRAGIGIGGEGDPMYTLQSGKQHAVAFTERGREQGRTLESQDELAYALTNPGSGGRTHSRQLMHGMAVRRLTPRECERLMGYEDDYTLIPEYRKVQKERGADAESLYAYYCRTERGRLYTQMRGGRVYSTPDGPRYKALGNSIAVPCLRWIGERIEMVESILLEAAA